MVRIITAAPPRRGNGRPRRRANAHPGWRQHGKQLRSTAFGARAAATASWAARRPPRAHRAPRAPRRRRSGARPSASGPSASRPSVTRMVNQWWTRLLQCRLRRLPERAGSRVRIPQHRARLPMEHRRHRRLGDGVPPAHRRRDPTRRRRAGGHVLHGVRRGHAAHDRRRLRRAQLPGLRHRRGELVRLLPGQPMDHRCARAARRHPLLHAAGLRRRR